MENFASRLASFKEVDIYPVVSSEFCLNRSVPDVIRAIGDGGAKIVQLREKNLHGLSLYKLACECRKITDSYNMLLLIDDALDIALASGADGVHLGQDDLPVAEAVKIAPQLIIGASTHNHQEVIDAQKDGCSYLNIGPVFPTQTKNVSCGALGMKLFSELKNLVKCPFTVMGGIKKKHIPLLREAGAEHIAMVTEITMAENISGTVAELIRIFHGR